MTIPSKTEIHKKLASLHKKQSRLYRIYQIKTFFGIPTKGLNEHHSLVLFSILQHNPNEPYTFVVVKGIDRIDPDSLNDYHTTALRIDENNYVSIFFNADKHFGDFVIGNNMAGKLGSDVISLLKNNFRKRIANKHYLKATEELIKSINRQLINHP